jgi:hypothetical protein
LQKLGIRFFERRFFIPVIGLCVLLLGLPVCAEERQPDQVTNEMIVQRALEYFDDHRSVDQHSTADTTIEGGRAERIIREGEILMADTSVLQSEIIYRHLLVEYGDRLYACLHMFTGTNIRVICAREGSGD